VTVDLRMARREPILPLRDCRVIDLSSWVTGAMATMILADLGADVVKVEPPAGDPYRRLRPRHAKVPIGALNVNRGKRSVALDLKNRTDHATLLRLLATADVLVENWRPGVADRLALDDAVLERSFPTLVHVAITGYGTDGPLAQHGAFDSLVQARTGLTMLRPVDGRPEPLPTYLADKVTGVFAAQAALAGLLERHRTGRGGRLDVPMLDAVAYFNFPDVLETRSLLSPDGDPESKGAAHDWRPSASYVATTVRTSDGWIAVSPTSRAQVAATCEAAGHPEWVDELAAFMNFGELAPELIRRLEGVTIGASSATWLARFAEHDVPAAPILDADGHLAEPQVVHNMIYAEMEHPTAGRVRYARLPLHGKGSRHDSSGAEPGSRPMPAIGEHNAEILAELDALPEATPAPGR
jgi:crotonobetainyl-CoA:carnitine CoA-transferase CaiB-like acyl-CoA transferase